MKLKAIAKFVGLVAGIAVTSLLIDKVVDKAYEGMEKANEDYADTDGVTVDVVVPASTCKTVAKAVVGAAALVLTNEYTTRRAAKVGFKYGVEGGIRYATIAFVDCDLSKNAGRLILDNPDALIHVRDQALPVLTTAYSK